MVAFYGREQDTTGQWMHQLFKKCIKYIFKIQKYIKMLAFFLISNSHMGKGASIQIRISVHKKGSTHSFPWCYSPNPAPLPGSQFLFFSVTVFLSNLQGKRTSIHYPLPMCCGLSCDSSFPKVVILIKEKPTRHTRGHIWFDPALLGMLNIIPNIGNFIIA